MALEIQVYARNMEVTDRIRDYTVKKVSKLERFQSGLMKLEWI
jgi:ribosome-associated translation inhibitor RaiA